jgi:cation diffusion facilitator family transporter
MKAAGPLIGSHATGRGTGKSRAAALSIASNCALIALKLAAGAITGSVAIITEAMHSAVDLIASIVAFVSVRQAEKPADDTHPYGHDKFENLAAAIEALLILVGSGVIVFESVRRLSTAHTGVSSLGVGMAIIAISIVVNVVVSGVIARRGRETDSPALEGDAAHLRTDAFTSLGVLVALALVAITGVDELDAVAALVVAVAIVFAGVRLVSRSSRVLVDEALPEQELERIASAVESYGAHEVLGYHKLRARRAGSHRYIDLHVQFARGTTLERAHQLSHELQEAIGRTVGGADILIHLEPEDALESREPGPLDVPHSAGLRR